MPYKWASTCGILIPCRARRLDPLRFSVAKLFVQTRPATATAAPAHLARDNPVYRLLLAMGRIEN
jgi:hypothetical protein